MSERKVLNKYYPPDYDPSKIPRIKRKNKQNDVRIMVPFNMRCSSCGEYIANATKFNAKKETIENETYNNLMIFRFFIRCPRCMNTIIFRTNPKEKGYDVELGATENFKALKDEERKAQEEAQAEEEEEKINPMKNLERRTKASKEQMEASEQIQNIRSLKHQFTSVNLDSLIEERRQITSSESVSGSGSDITKEARMILKRKKPDDLSDFSRALTKPSTSSIRPPSALSNIKKKLKIIKKDTQS